MKDHFLTMINAMKRNQFSDDSDSDDFDDPEYKQIMKKFEDIENMMFDIDQIKERKEEDMDELFIRNELYAKQNTRQLNFFDRIEDRPEFGRVQ